RVVRQQEALFSSVYEGLIAVDPEGHITAINRNARKMLGLPSPERIASRLAMTLRPLKLAITSWRLSAIWQVKKSAGLTTSAI
ncbi:PAS domain-containing protein, partial [Salmonella enterica subsp. enterica serovar Lubbock]|nr:PAS domain-containing protein [Salmonella enterica subsp. enterica serovar Lubbock]